MKILYVIASLFLVNVVSCQSNHTIAPIENSVLTEILNAGLLIDVNSYSMEIEKNVYVKIYKVPKQGQCIEETNTVCSYTCYLAISEIDEFPKQAVFKLGEYGDIIDIEWGETQKQDYAEFTITTSNYPLQIANDQKLKITKETYSITGNTDSLRIIQN